MDITTLETVTTGWWIARNSTPRSPSPTECCTIVRETNRYNLPPVFFIGGQAFALRSIHLRCRLSVETGRSKDFDDPRRGTIPNPWSEFTEILFLNVAIWYIYREREREREKFFGKFEFYTRDSRYRTIGTRIIFHHLEMKITVEK